ncbi:MAG: IclR family transcriptional regulator [Solirubrobacterales bacterium]
MTAAPAAGQALDILVLLGTRIAPMPASAIARELGLPRSTVYHLLGVLRRRGFVVHLAEERRYGLGTAAFELGSAYSRQEPLRWVARTVLTSLVAETGQHAHFAVLDGRDTLYLLEERAPGKPSLVTEVGIRLPATLTASGLAILAAMPPRQVRALWPSREDLARRHGQGPSTLTQLRQELVETRRRGWAVEDGFITVGFCSVATAVLDHTGFPQASVALTFQAAEVDDAARLELAARATEAGRTISRHIHGRVAAPT